MSNERRQIEAIKSEMQHLRSRLPHGMDAARAKAKQFTDWKFYLRRYPAATAVGAGLLAYWIVPHRKTSRNEPTVVRVQEPQMTAKVAKKATAAGLITSLLTTLVTRAATQYAGGYADKLMNQYIHASAAASSSVPPTNGAQRRRESPQASSVHPSTSPSKGNGFG